MTGYILSHVAKIRKKGNKSKKSCLEVSDRSKNPLSAQRMLVLLCFNNRLPNQLLLSSEIGQLLSGLAKISEIFCKFSEILM